MSEFPYAPRDVAVELFLAGQWRDITSDVRQSAKINVSRGRPNEASSLTPSSCSMTINNRSGTYSPRNPNGLWFGYLGRNTPIRVAIRTAKDAFARTTANGWGTADVGGAWTASGTASKFSTSGGVAKHTYAAANDSVFAYQATQVYQDIDVTAAVSMPFSTVTGASVEPLTLIVGGLSTVDYYFARMLISTAGVITVDLSHSSGGAVAAPIVVPITYSGQTLQMRVQLFGLSMRAKVWIASAGEPYAWDVSAHTDGFVNRAAGWTGIRSGTQVGNTNATRTFSFDVWEVRSNRFAGEVASWPSSWDVSGRDMYVPIVCSGPLRRIGQGATPVKSTLYRGYTTMTPAPIGYWPVEDGSESTLISSALPGGSAMSVSGTTSRFGADSNFKGSAPIGQPAGDQWSGRLNVGPNSGVVQATFLLYQSSAETIDTQMFRVFTNGTAAWWDLQTQATTGSVQLLAYDSGGNVILASGWSANPLATAKQWSIELQQSGGDVLWAVVSLAPGSNAQSAFFGTLVGYSITTASNVQVNPYQFQTSFAIGHIMVRDYLASLLTLGGQLNAYSGETANTRIARICAENTIPVDYKWDGYIRSALVGYQGLDTALNIIKEAAEADLGSLSESRSDVGGLMFRIRSSLYNQPPRLTLDYSAGQLADPFRPVEDDQANRNEVTANRKNGASATATQLTGRMAVTAPALGGVGRYDDAVTVNVRSDDQLLNVANWLVLLGTVDEARYPQINVDLAKLATISRALELSVLDMDVDDRLTITLPKLLHDPDTISQQARGYSESFGGFEHTVTFNCVPDSPYQVVQLDSPALGKLDSDTSTVSTGINSSATTVLVDTTAGSPLWTTVAADMPIPIKVGGEQMTVTNITGAASPQTFTVTRSVNRVVKSHIAGTKVSLARRATLAL
jgi:hypothetical protein